MDGARPFALRPPRLGRENPASPGGTSKVIFGASGDATLLGAVTLEELGLMLDPLRRELRPLPMLLV